MLSPYSYVLCEEIYVQMMKIMLAMTHGIRDLHVHLVMEADSLLIRTVGHEKGDIATARTEKHN